jgi:hypothetical protein
VIIVVSILLNYRRALIGDLTGSARASKIPASLKQKFSSNVVPPAVFFLKMQNSAAPFSVFPTAAQALLTEARKLLPPKDALSAESAEAKVREAIRLAEVEPAAQGTADLGSAFLFLGQVLELQGKPEKLEEASAAYDRAKDIFAALPQDQPGLRRLSALAWMNRGNVLQKLSKPDDVAAYDQAISLLVDLTDDLEARSVLSAIYMNRGSGLQRQNTPEARKTAAESFGLAVATLEKLSTEGQSQFVPLLAAARVNYAGALLGVPGSEFKTIRSSAIAALQIVANAEDKELGAVDLGLRARRILCESVALLLGNPNLPPKARGELISEGTDIAEAALALCGRWEQRNVPNLRPMVGWFFSFGGALYARQQPQFLAEFLSDTLQSENTPAPWKSAPQLAKIATDAIALAREGIQTRLGQPISDEQKNALTDTLAELNTAAEKYASLAKQA